MLIKESMCKLQICVKTDFEYTRASSDTINLGTCQIQKRHLKKKSNSNLKPETLTIPAITARLHVFELDTKAHRQRTRLLAGSLSNK